MLEGINEEQSVDIFIRHGKSKYTNEFPDLTEEGLAEIKASGADLSPLLNRYRRIRYKSSPAVRAVGSLHTFSVENGNQSPSFSLVDDIRPVDIYKFSEFMAALSDPNYHKEYEAYLLKEDFDNPDPKTQVCERRSDIRKRAIDYFINRMESEDHKEEAEPICFLNFTHFEIMSNLLALLYGENEFPIDHAEGPKNGEAIAIQKYSPREMIIYARSMSKIVSLSKLK